ncbi:MAG TPA: dihydroneopterin aldolase [Hyphomicrobiaceae bacterium]|nr:dihydroneopterin aldolase [Hyphomicrobiaceae bacterium]
MSSNDAAPARSDNLRPTERGWRRVFVEALELVGSVGVYELERRYEQRIIVTLDLLVRDDYSGDSDELDRVYDYDRAISAIRSTVEGGHFNLLETLAERIVDTCLADERVQEVRVRIAKPDVLPACRAVGIEVCRARR